MCLLPGSVLRQYSFELGCDDPWVLVQIYGITTAQDAAEVDRLGPDTIGVVLDEGIPTWDSVDDATARRIVFAVKRARVVALSLSTDPERILATFRTLKPDILHLARAVAVEMENLRRIDHSRLEQPEGGLVRADRPAPVTSPALGEVQG